MLTEKLVNTELKYSCGCSSTCAWETMQGRNRDTLLHKSFAGGSVECTEV